VRRLHSGPNEQDEGCTRLKEALELGYFTDLYNISGNAPKLVWARANARGTGHADFTVWDLNKRWSRDVELTSAWADEDAFPKTLNTNYPGMVDLRSARRRSRFRSCGRSCRRQSRRTSIAMLSERTTHDIGSRST
jgi:hypothetical protein